MAATRTSRAAPPAARATRNSTRWVLGLGDALRAEADEAFPADRLAVQQAQIARRLETLERPARVIAFPKAARAVISGHSHVRRWVTVAAAAGLIAGIGLGQVVPLRQAFQQQQAAGAGREPDDAPDRENRRRAQAGRDLGRRRRAAARTRSPSRASARSARSTR